MAVDGGNVMVADTVLKPGGHSCGTPWPGKHGPIWVPCSPCEVRCPSVPSPGPVSCPATGPITPAQVSLWPADRVGPWSGDGWSKALGSWTKVEPQGTMQPLVWGPQHPLLHAPELLVVVRAATRRGWGSSISAFVPDKPSSGMDADDVSDLGAKAPMLSHVLSQAPLPDLGCFLPLTVMPVKSLKTSVGLVPKASSTCVTHVKWDLTGFC